ncbi:MULTISPECIES: DUF3040 domain-containing protein [Streptomyces]|uniref:DUF3040 domain-containing protein n=2 Tax=Streptomyces sudanensis TaxID=436397 RepID=A0ABY4TKZ1_9ACTN|nr:MULTISPECIES: DUF3040 domain-containing protein [Streptomyces]MCP9960026.1 DUF3040 domain-containing protein [Streptomyces sudanensis]MCP9999575.1 DUF3040 domain-containing protein [Streptomyces sudanensis]URN18353.1 DUF3040 domain-containing protein [Streptomyces sudanensis]
MASGMDENRLLAEIERLLARDDPGLEARMSELTRQFADDPPAPGAAPPGGPDGDDGDGQARRERDWRKVLALVAVVVAVVGLLLTAILTQPPGSGTGPPPGSPAGLPAATVPRA